MGLRDWWRGKDEPGKQRRYVSVGWGFSQYKCCVEKISLGFVAILHDKHLLLLKSDDGTIGAARTVGFSDSPYMPLSGWSSAELRELGFAVSDDGMIPQEIQLARAVLAGDRAAAAALADWVMENWKKTE